jgi:hypothetical protein
MALQLTTVQRVSRRLIRLRWSQQFLPLVNSTWQLGS